jgi:hypothetical protein
MHKAGYCILYPYISTEKYEHRESRSYTNVVRWCELLDGCFICLSAGDRLPLVNVVLPVCVLHISESLFSSLFTTVVWIKAGNCLFYCHVLVLKNRKREKIIGGHG